jgi:hypothetical protein
MAYEAVESVEPRASHGAPVVERLLGTKATEDEAIELARAARAVFLESGSSDYAWWVVREPGMTLARWIADSTSSKEFVLDLRSGELVEY